MKWVVIIIIKFNSLHIFIKQRIQIVNCRIVINRKVEVNCRIAKAVVKVKIEAIISSMIIKNNYKVLLPI